MTSIVADFAKTRAEYALLVAVLGTLGEDQFNEAHVRTVFEGVLNEYRALPE